MSHSICHHRFTFAILSAATFALAACSSDNAQNPQTCDVCPATTFGGVWTGQAHFSPSKDSGTSSAVKADAPEYTYTPAIVARDDGKTLALSAFGPKGDGSVVLPIGSSAVDWAGVSVVSIGNDLCPEATVEYTKGHIAVVDGTLSVHLEGISHWCGGDYSSVLDFVASSRKSLDANHTEMLDCDLNPTASACQLSCEETGTCLAPPSSVVLNGGMNTTDASVAPLHWSSIPISSCGIGGWGTVALSSQVADPDTGGGWSVKFPASNYANAGCSYYTEFQAQPVQIPTGTTSMTFAMDALSKSLPTLTTTTPYVYVAASIRWMFSDCVAKVTNDTQISMPDTQWPGANTSTNDFGRYSVAVSVPSTAACAMVTVRAYFRPDRDLFIDNVTLTPR